jgi:hypothetical protein
VWLGFIDQLLIKSSRDAKTCVVLVNWHVFWQIPSTYGPERLDLLRQLEKVKEMETSDENPNENGEEQAWLEGNANFVQLSKLKKIFSFMR